MKFVINGKDNADLEVVSLAEISPEDMVERTNNETGEKKLVDGKPTFKCQGVEVLDGGRKTRNVYVSLFEPQKVKRFTPYRFDGKTVVNVYSTKDGALTTITAERLVEVGNEPSQGNPSKPII